VAVRNALECEEAAARAVQKPHFTCNLCTAAAPLRRVRRSVLYSVTEMLYQRRPREELMEDLSKGTLETILVVDDNKAVLKLVAAVLKDANYRVIVAISGPDALRVAEELDGKIDRIRQSNPTLFQRRRQ
jgi:PleD family two-component response regulator